LSKGQWDKLEMLWLGMIVGNIVGNEVGNDNRYSIRKEGLEHLSKARWPNLTVIKICATVITQQGTASDLTQEKCYRKPIGPSLNL
jgi:hypothetical protein